MAKKYTIVVDGTTAAWSAGTLTITPVSGPARTFEVGEGEYAEMTDDEAQGVVYVIDGWVGNLYKDICAARDPGTWLDFTLNPWDWWNKIRKRYIK